MRRGNLKVVTSALVKGLSMSDERAVGVAYVQDGMKKAPIARKEVILAAGAIESPYLLQVSGIGDPDHLVSIGAPVHHALPGVGEGLQDHYAARIVNRVTKPITLNERAHGPRLLWEIAKWMVAGRGLLAYSPAHVAGFVRSRSELDLPDLQLVFTPASYSDGVTGTLHREPGMTAEMWQMRPESRGYVRARTSDSNDAPAIQPNYLGAETDRQAATAGIR